MIGNIIIGVIGYGAAVFFALVAIWAIAAKPMPGYTNRQYATVGLLAIPAALAFAGITKWMTGL